MDAVALMDNEMARGMELAILLKMAYEDNKNLIIGCFYDMIRMGQAFQAYLGTECERLMVCFTSKSEAKKKPYGIEWNEAKARDILNNIFNKRQVVAIIFNPCSDKEMIVPIELLKEFMPGEKPKPEGFVPAK